MNEQKYSYLGHQGGSAQKSLSKARVIDISPGRKISSIPEISCQCCCHGVPGVRVAGNSCKCDEMEWKCQEWLFNAPSRFNLRPRGDEWSSYGYFIRLLTNSREGRRAAPPFS